MSVNLTEGGRLVAELVAKVGAAEFGRRVRTSEGMARHIATGRKTPGDELKIRICEKFGVALSAWDVPASTPPAVRKKREKVAEKPLPKVKPKLELVKPSTPAKVEEVAVADEAHPVKPEVYSAVGKLRTTIEEVEEALELVASDPLAAPAHRAQLLRVKVDACDKLAKLQGEGELTMATLVRSRIWRELLGKLEPVFDKHPDAAAEIASVLEALEEA